MRTSASLAIMLQGIQPLNNPLEPGRRFGTLKAMLRLFDHPLEDHCVGDKPERIIKRILSTGLYLNRRPTQQNGQLSVRPT